MKLALKVILATTLGMLVVLIGFGYYRTQRQVALLDADMQRDHRLVGTTLGLCVARTWSWSGQQRALELIAQADVERPQLRISWIDADGNRRGRKPLDLAVDKAEFRRLSHATTTDPDLPGQELLVTRVPVATQGEFLGAIEIAESLAARQNDIRASISNTIVATLVMFAIAGLITLVFGVWLVGRPLDLLTEKARRVGEGDLSAPLQLSQRDEIGELANEMNAMCERLAEAHSRTALEASAKIRALEQLRHADRLITVGQLAAGIAHELGTPLNVIAGRTKLLRRGNVGSAQSEEYLSVIADQTERIAAIVRQLLDFARRREPNRVRADLQTMTRSILRLMEPTARKRGVELSCATSEPVFASVDRPQFEQVISNLIVNAIHACSEGGQVVISCGLGKAGSGAMPDGQPAGYVRVQDDGHGMAEATKSRVFEPFFTTKEVGQGTGLGLSVAYGIVEEHGGSIVVESQPDRGSTFTVCLPVAIP